METDILITEELELDGDEIADDGKDLLFSDLSHEDVDDMSLDNDAYDDNDPF